MVGGKGMKITVVHGQKHHGSTWNSTRLLRDFLMTENDECNEFFVKDIPNCVGCFTCILKDEEKCPHRSLIQPIIHSLDESDIIIVETPNYCMGMTGQLKNFFDHMAYRWFSHRPLGEMKNKVAIAVSTTAGLGAKTATKQMAKQLFWWGVPKVYRLHEAVAASNWEEVKPEIKLKIERKADKIAKKARKNHKRVHWGMRQKLIFNMMGRMQKAGLGTPKDATYWKEQGWI